jgi:hypothetical protein
MRVTLPYLATQFKLAESIVALGTAAFTQILPVNTNRYAVLFCSVLGGQINLSRNANGPLTGSLTLANAANASVQFMTLNFDEVGGLVQDAWFAVGNIAGQSIGINEVMYLPTGEIQE